MRQAPGTATRALWEKGTIVRFGDRSITNPLTGDCAASPDYTRLKSGSGTALAAKEGKSWPTSFRRILLNARQVRSGFLICEGLNYMRVIVTAPGTAYFFYEGGLIFELQRVPGNAAGRR